MWLQHNFTGNRGRDFLIAILMGGPAFLLLTFFLIVPFGRAIYLSRTNQLMVQPKHLAVESVGFAHYDNLLSLSVAEVHPQMDATTGDYMRDPNGNLLFRWRPKNPPEGYEHLKGYNLVNTFHIADWGLLPDKIRGKYYAIVAKDPIFWQALWNNLIFTAIVVPVQGGIALLLALLVDQKLRGMNVFRTIYFSPVVTAMAVIAVLWVYLYNPDRGLINKMLEAISFGHLGPYQWLDSPTQAMPALIIMSIWQGAGFQMIIFLAGLQDIPPDLYEAAGIDGAGLWGKFRFVTLPLLRNTMIFIVVTTTTLAFRLYTQVEVMTQGGPQNSTITVVWYNIQQGWRTGNGNVGYASAISVLFVSIILFITLFQRGLLRSESALER
jgi:multiple sugar transport system permease protein